MSRSNMADEDERLWLSCQIGVHMTERRHVHRGRR